MDKEKTPLLILSILAIALILIASVTGIALDDGGSPHIFTSLRGEEVEIYGGQGLYRYNNVYKAVIFRSFDWVNLVIVLPLFALGLYRRGQLKGRLLLAAIFTYLAYIYAIGVMGNVFNSMFLVWTALIPTGLGGLFLVLSDMGVAALPGKLKSNFPAKSLAVYVFVVGIILFAQYLAEIIAAYTTGTPPTSLEHYTTLELAALELGIMIPLHILGGILLWRNKAWGYVIAILLAFAAFMVFIALSVSLLLLYFSFGRGNVFDMAVTIAIAVVASGFSLVIFRQVMN